MELEGLDHGDLRTEHEDNVTISSQSCSGQVLNCRRVSGVKWRIRHSVRTSGIWTKSFVMESVLFKTSRMSSMGLSSSMFETTADGK